MRNQRIGNTIDLVKVAGMILLESDINIFSFVLRMKSSIQKNGTKLKKLQLAKQSLTINNPN